jgi:hypothetical protein
VKIESRRRRRVFEFGEAHAPALLRVNKAIRNEARQLLYALNTFAFKSSESFSAFYEKTKTACHLLEQVEFFDIRHVLPIAAFTHARRLRQVTITVNLNSRLPIDQRAVKPFFRAIDNLVLECGCTRCAGDEGPPDPYQDREYCIRRLPAERKKRLETITIHTSDERIHLKEAFAATGTIRHFSGTLQEHIFRRARTVVDGIRVRMCGD